MKMLELPESHSMAKQLNETIQGKVIRNVYANSSPHGFAFFSGEPALYPSLLYERKVGESKAVGGMVEITLDTSRLLFGDGINIRYFESGKPIPKKHQLHIEFEDDSSLVCTVQMYGGIWAYKEGENTNPYYLVAREKPTPLSDAFDETYFKEMLCNTKQSISVKAFLATEQRIPGLGNGSLQDILFVSSIHPKRKLESLSEEEVDNLFKSVKKTILEMYTKGGRDTEKDLFGVSGGYHTILSSKTLKNPCPVCGSAITRQAYMGGNVYYCPICQPL